MSGQYRTQPPTKQQRSRKTHATNQQNGKQASVLQRPANDDREAWKAYWKEHGQPWGTEPEIDEERQKYLAERCTIIPDIEQGIYPFKDIKLTRADVEWLLATHENGRGPVDWNDQSQREREGLDLRGANLDREDLSRLPLARLRGGLKGEVWVEVTEEVRIMAALSMQEVNLSQANLQQAELLGANLQRSFLSGVNFQEADLTRANLQQTRIEVANLQQAELSGANLQQASLQQSDLQKAYFGHRLYYLFEEGGNIRKQVHIDAANLQQASLNKANLQRTSFLSANLQKADFRGASFEKTSLEGAILADELNTGPFIADAQWGDTNLAIIDWSKIKVLGDEYKAYQRQPSVSVLYPSYNYSQKTRKDKDERKAEFQAAIRANRQLATALQAQGLNEVAARFAYRAQVLQRKVFWYQRRFGQYFFSFFLDQLAGYGYRLGRSFIAYALVISIFATIYYLLGVHIAWNEAIVISMTAFHGRGFFPDQFHPGDPQALVAAIEAFVGLLIEVTFIATLTQRLFGK